MSDLASTRFLTILQHITLKQGKVIVTIDRCEATSQTCSCCGAQKSGLASSDLSTIYIMGLSPDHDRYTAINAYRAGTSAQGLRGQ